MTKAALSLVLSLSLFAATFAQTKSVPVFVSGTEGYHTFRIPALISLPDGKLLAFAEGRVKGSGDFGNIDIVMKQSADRGKSWSALQIVADNDSLQAANPTPVVDRTDPAFPGGRIFLFYVTGNKKEDEIMDGHGLKEVWYKTSADGGRTWSEAVNITAQVHRPYQPDLNADYHFKEAWRAYFTNPGHAMQFQQGRYRGRIFVSANHSVEPRTFYANGFFTDDHGKSFQLGTSLTIAGSNESIAAELSHDRLMMNSRNQQGDIRSRIISISNDGGATWASSYFDPHLPDPVCQGSLLTIGQQAGRSILAFCNPADLSHRDNLTLRISYDEGKSWKKNILVAQHPASGGATSTNYAAYSDLTLVGKRRIGVLYEKEHYSQIVFTRIKWR